MYKKILIATDGSDTAKKAAATGVSLASSVGADVVLLFVGDDATGTPILEGVRAELGIEADLKCVTGDPADQILATAESEGADLIVVGNKGMTGAKRFLLGSVPNQISHNATTNVLIVKTT